MRWAYEQVPRSRSREPDACPAIQTRKVLTQATSHSCCFPAPPNHLAHAHSCLWLQALLWAALLRRKGSRARPPPPGKLACPSGAMTTMTPPGTPSKGPSHPASLCALHWEASQLCPHGPCRCRPDVGHLVTWQLAPSAGHMPPGELLSRGKEAREGKRCFLWDCMAWADLGSTHMAAASYEGWALWIDAA